MKVAHRARMRQKRRYSRFGPLVPITSVTQIFTLRPVRRGTDWYDHLYGKCRR